MQTQKMSLANIKGKLSRAEMKNIMAGSGSAGCACQGSIGQWTYTSGAPNCYNRNQDVATYCRSGSATCWGGCTLYA